MVAQNVIADKEILITETDFSRLRNLMESPRYRSTHAALLMTLNEELHRGTIVTADEVPQGIVTMNSQVRFRDLKGHGTETYTLVYPQEADINEGKLSVLAPLGTALLGARVGQVVTFDAPAGVRRVRVEKILYQPEAAGDFHL
jgi:regulator of nucleoside diphosphate kinase